MDASSRFIEKHRLRIFRNGGTAVGATPDASDAPRIDGSPVALSTEAGGPPVSATRAFYLKPEADHDKLAAIRLSGGSDVVGAQAATKVSTAGGAAVYLAPERVVGDKNGDGDDFDSVAYFYGVRANGNACNIPLVIRRPGAITDEVAAATDIAMSEQVIVAMVSEHDHFGAVLNDDGDTADDVVYMWKTSDLVANCQTGASVAGTNLAYAADAIAAWGSRAVWVAPETAQKTGLPRCQPTAPAGGCDLNKDQDSNDRVLMSASRSGATIDIVSSAVATADFELGDPSSGLIAIRVPEASQRASLNGDGDWNDSVLHVYRPSCWQEALNSKWSALPCTFASCDPRRPYRVDDDTVWFLTDQRQPGPIALAAFVAPRCNPPFPAIIPNTPLSFISRIQPRWPLIRTQFLGENLLMLGGHEDVESSRPSPVLVAGDADHDGVLDPFDNCVEFSNADRLDADADGIGDRYCDPTPAACPPRPRKDCLGDDDVVSPTGLCFAQTADQLEFAWSWQGGSRARPVHPGDPINGQPHYSVCVYPKDAADQAVVAAAALPWPECGEPPCWRGDVERGFVLSGDRKLPRNLETLVLPGTAAHSPTLYAKGAVPRSGLHAFALDRPATVQLILQVGGKPVQCWSSTHQPAQTLAACPNPVTHADAATSPVARTAPLLPKP